MIAGNVAGIDDLEGGHAGTDVDGRGRFDGIAHEDIGDRRLRPAGLVVGVRD